MTTLRGWSTICLRTRSVHLDTTTESVADGQAPADMTSTPNILEPDAPVRRTARELYLAGTGSFAVEVAEWAEDAGQAVVGLIELLDSSRVGVALTGRSVLAPDSPPAGGLYCDRPWWESPGALCVPSRMWVGFGNSGASACSRVAVGSPGGWVYRGARRSCGR
jgi:hypothetical protein